ncbi:VRR-NUC domain-containing protein [Nocardioides sp. TRM66260-LWL]|uniref:VRR-NUC domain-containing protein n=1 Tax=Nocardioides sp. TRM66260-LWL TaxID=2874478 RepID=UPI001CC3CAD0|nr:VRR-NUC domain-containing protein [Nocardioides sp. TRM66260-LWL]MBZ5736472.1 VRR-NUC domain-containing protein [Nocardioides sp. TRM66260-LWL]
MTRPLEHVVMPLPDDISEAMFQRHLLQLAAWHGLLSYHTHDSRRSQPGFPDCVLLGPAGVIYAELKTTKGRVTPEQREWLDRLTAAGQTAYLWRPTDWPEINLILRDLAHPKETC